MPIVIRKAHPQHLKSVLAVEEAAFNSHEEADLTRTLLEDPSAAPRLSLLAFDEDIPVGHILFTHATLENHTRPEIAILAPLAVIPAKQNQGVGGQLINAGLARLRQAGVTGVFVLGHIGYYPKYGFRPALPQGFNAPYAPPQGFEDAWMVQWLDASYETPAQNGGRIKVKCCTTFNRPEYWRE